MARIPTAQEAGLGGTGILPTRSVPVRPFFGSAVGATPEAFGAGAGQGLSNLAAAGQQAGATLMDIATEIQIEKTERAAKDADLQYSKRLREMMYGDGTPDNPGYYGLEGQAAVDQQAATIAAMEAAREQIAETLGENQRARQMFGDAAAVRLDQEMKRVSTHSFRQGKVANEQMSQARRNEFIDDAVARYNDPSSVAQLLASGISEVYNYEVDKGTDPEVAASIVGEYTTQFHAAIIDRHLSEGDTATAQAWFDEHRDQIDGRSHSDILDRIASGHLTQAGEVKRVARDLIAVLNSGRVPAEAESIKAQLDAIPVGSAGEGLETIRADFYEALGDAPIVADALRQPLAEVEADLATFRARAASPEPPTLEEFRVNEKIERQYARMQEQFANGDGLIAAAEQGVIPALEPVDFMDPDSIAQRVAVADTASQVYGVEILPMTAQDVDAFAAAIVGDGSATPPAIEDVVTMMGNVHQVMGEDAAAFAIRDLLEKKHKHIGVALNVAKDRPLIAQEIIAGGRQRAENPEFKVSKDDRLLHAPDVLGNLLTEATAEARGDILDAAEALYVKRAIQSGVTTFDSTLYREAITDTLGGIVEHNGQRVIPPTPGMDQGTFSAVMNRVSNATLLDENGDLPVFEDGTEFTADQLRASIFRDEAVLVSTSMEGTYNVLIPGVGYVLNADQSQPYELDLRAMLPSLAPGRTDSLIPPSFLTEAGEAILPPVVEAERELAEAMFEDRELTTALADIPAPKVGSRGGPPVGTEIAMGTARRFTAVAEFEAVNGVPTKAYKDSRGIPTIGVGYNLNRPDARATLESMGYRYEDVISGKQEITRADAMRLFQRTYAEAREQASQIVPGYRELDRPRQVLMNDLVFNMGAETLSGFRGFLAAMAAQDYDLAADHLEWVDPTTKQDHTPYWNQTGRRAKRNVRVLRSGKLDARF